MYCLHSQTFVSQTIKQLRHDNLVNLLEVWKRRRRWYLVFEFVDRTLLDDLEQNPSGLNLNTSRQYLYQILRAADFCHQQNVRINDRTFSLTLSENVHDGLKPCFRAGPMLRQS